MGLLTDTKQRQVLVRLILKYHQKLSVLLYIAGLAWFLALAYRPLNAGTYFSENALLPGGSLDWNIFVIDWFKSVFTVNQLIILPPLRGLARAWGVGEGGGERNGGKGG